MSHPDPNESLPISPSSILLSIGVALMSATLIFGTKLSLLLLAGTVAVSYWVNPKSLQDKFESFVPFMQKVWTAASAKKQSYEMEFLGAGVAFFISGGSYIGLALGALATYFTYHQALPRFKPAPETEIPVAVPTDGISPVASPSSMPFHGIRMAPPTQRHSTLGAFAALEQQLSSGAGTTPPQKLTVEDIRVPHNSLLSSSAASAISQGVVITPTLTTPTQPTDDLRAKRRRENHLCYTVM